MKILSTLFIFLSGLLVYSQSIDSKSIDSNIRLTTIPPSLEADSSNNVLYHNENLQPRTFRTL